jgi:hypothetical protein
VILPLNRAQISGSKAKLVIIRSFHHQFNSQALAAVERAIGL